MNDKITGRDIGFLALVVAILIITISAFHLLNAGDTPTSAEIRMLIESQQVETLTVKDSTLTMTLKQPWNDQLTVTAKLWSPEGFYSEYREMLASQKRTGVLTDYNFETTELPMLISFLPWLILMVFAGLLLYVVMTRQANAAGGGIGGDRASHFNRARTKTVNAEGKKYTFADVAGADEEKAELQEVEIGRAHV